MVRTLLAASIWLGVSLVSAPAAAEALSGVCPDGSIFIVQRHADIPCKRAKLVDSAELPPIRPQLLPRPYMLPVLAQLVLLGAVTYVSVSYSDGLGRHHSSTNVGVHGFWIGGYENECRWYGAFMDAYGVAKVGVVVTALNLIFGVLAIAVKLTVVEQLEALSARRADSLR